MTLFVLNVLCIAVCLGLGAYGIMRWNPLLVGIGVAGVFINAAAVWMRLAIWAMGNERPRRVRLGG